jgi:hypothetical protein
MERELEPLGKAQAYDTDKIIMDNYDVCVTRPKYDGIRSFCMRRDGIA